MKNVLRIHFLIIIILGDSSCLLCVLWQTELKVDDGEACKVLPQVKHLSVSVVIEL